jgi:membrane-associated phospholipid phosphatase
MAGVMLLLTWLNGLHAQDTLTFFNSAFFASLARDGVAMVQKPFHATPRKWLTGSATVALVAASLLLDNEVNRLIQKNQHDDARYWFQYGANPWGNLYSYLFVSAWYLRGRLEPDRHSCHVALQATKALLINAAITKAVKYTIRRQRPLSAHADDDIHPWEREQSLDSFYSGHASAAMAVATVFAHEYRHYSAVALAAYGLAGMAATARIYLNKHWLSDVATGCLMGFYIGKTVCRPSAKQSRISFFPGKESRLIIQF